MFSLPRILSQKTRFVLTCLLALGCQSAAGQTWYPVTVTTGTQRIYDVDVAVSHGGSISGYPSLNDCFSPYWVGHPGPSGFYTFDFTPAASGAALPHLILRIRLAEINEGETVTFSVNGSPYLLTPAQLSNLGTSCTVNGNFQPGLPGLVMASDSIYCPPGAVGTVVPWKNSIEVKISGAIHSLTIAGSNCFNGGVGFGLHFSYVSHNSGPVCAGEDLELHARWVVPGTTYAWAGPAGFSSNLRDPVIPDAQPENEGIYTLRMVSPTDSVTDTMYISVLPTPNAEIIVEEPVCAGSTLNLSTADTLPGVSFRWGGPNGFVSAARRPSVPNVQPHHAGVYHVVATLGSCSDSAEAEIEVRLPVSDSLAGHICAGDRYDFYGSLLKEPGVYTHAFTAANGCDSTIVLDLDVLPVPHTSFSISQKESRLCIEDTVSIFATGAHRYLWYREGTEIARTPELTYPLTGFSNELMVVGAEENGCTDTVEISLFAESCCKIFLTDAFTPNGDGRNDRFGPVTRTAAYMRDYRMDIFNRWGELVFSGLNPGDRWDGYYKGTEAETGTYFYHVQGKCLEGTSINQQGTVLLIR